MLLEENPTFFDGVSIHTDKTTHPQLSKYKHSKDPKD